MLFVLELFDLPSYNCEVRNKHYKKTLVDYKITYANTSDATLSEEIALILSTCMNQQRQLKFLQYNAQGPTT